MGVVQLQNNFTRGELDPRIVSRNDLESYYNGVFLGDNVLPLVQGGLRTRPGQEYVGTALGDARLERFAFNVEQQYLLVWSDLRLQIYKDGALLPSISGGNNYIVTPYTIADVRAFDFIQSADTGIVTHEDHQPRTLVRLSDTNWTFNTVTLVNIPKYDFNDTSSPTPVSEVQTIQFTTYNSGDRFKIALEGILTDELVFASTDGQTALNIKQGLLDLPNTGNDGIAVSVIAVNKFQVTLSGNSAKAWGLMTTSPVLTKDAAASTAEARTATGTSRAENAWSAGRGWPRTCTFHQARLWFGGSKSLPQSIWGSRVSDFFDFNSGRGRDDESIFITLDTDQVNAVNGVYSNRNLQIFTTGNEFYIPQQFSEPITPGNVQALPQTNYGSARVRPVTIDGLTLYPQKSGKNLRQFVFVDSNQAYSSNSVSLLAAHLINSPVQLAAAKGSTEVDANYVYIVNGDGTLTVFNSLVSEGIVAFTRWTTGNVRSVAIVDNALYLLVCRVVNGSTVYYIEREDDTLNTDSALTVATAGSDVVTGLSHLEGETVKVKADGAVLLDAVVTSGQITMERTAQSVEVGLEWTPTIITMPVNVVTDAGPTAPTPKRIIRVFLSLYESLGVIVNGERIADKKIGVDQFDAPAPSTRLEEVYLLGWNVDSRVTITRDGPVPFTILSLGMEVAT